VGGGLRCDIRGRRQTVEHEARAVAVDAIARDRHGEWPGCDVEDGVPADPDRCARGGHEVEAIQVVGGLVQAAGHARIALRREGGGGEHDGEGEGTVPWHSSHRHSADRLGVVGPPGTTTDLAPVATSIASTRQLSGCSLKMVTRMLVPSGDQAGRSPMKATSSSKVRVSPVATVTMSSRVTYPPHGYPRSTATRRPSGDHATARSNIALPTGVAIHAPLAPSGSITHTRLRPRSSRTRARRPDTRSQSMTP